MINVNEIFFINFLISRFISSKLFYFQGNLLTNKILFSEKKNLQRIRYIKHLNAASHQRRAAFKKKKTSKRWRQRYYMSRILEYF